MLLEQSEQTQHVFIKSGVPRAGFPRRDRLPRPKDGHCTRGTNRRKTRKQHNLNVHRKVPLAMSVLLSRGNKWLLDKHGAAFYDERSAHTSAGLFPVIFFILPGQILTLTRTGTGGMDGAGPKPTSQRRSPDDKVLLAGANRGADDCRRTQTGAIERSPVLVKGQNTLMEGQRKKKTVTKP